MGTDIPRHRPVGKGLFTGSVQLRTLLTEWFSACAFAQVFGLDVVASVAFSVVVVNRLFHRVPSCLFRHSLKSFRSAELFLSAGLISLRSPYFYLAVSEETATRFVLLRKS